MLKRFKIDYGLLIATITILTIGLVMVYSSSSYYALENFHDYDHFLNRTLKWIILGFFAMAFTAILPYKLYKKSAIALGIYGASIALLIYVLIAGDAVRGAYRWAEIAGFRLQPSEVAKIAVILGTAYFLDKFNPLGDSFIKNRLIKFGILIGLNVLVAFLVYIEPSKSAAVIIASIAMSVLFVYGVPIWAFLSMSFLGGGIMYSLAIRQGYSSRRFFAMLNPLEAKADESWQLVQTLFALGLGGIRGQGLGRSMQNKLYIPDAQNDFILGIIGEEFGIWGITLVMMIYIFMIYRIIKIAISSTDRFAALVCSGVGAMLFIHVALNFMVVMGWFPPTGITLPLISYGGTSTIVFMTAIGIVLNISASRSRI